MSRIGAIRHKSRRPTCSRGSPMGRRLTDHPPITTPAPATNEAHQPLGLPRSPRQLERRPRPQPPEGTAPAGPAEQLYCAGVEPNLNPSGERRPESALPKTRPVPSQDGRRHDEGDLRSQNMGKRFIGPYRSVVSMDRARRSGTEAGFRHDRDPTAKRPRDHRDSIEAIIPPALGPVDAQEWGGQAGRNLRPRRPPPSATNWRSGAIRPKSAPGMVDTVCRALTTVVNRAMRCSMHEDGSDWGAAFKRAMRTLSRKPGRQGCAGRGGERG